MSRVLVTGSQGMLGQDILLGLKGHDVTGMSRSTLDITDRHAVTTVIPDFDIVINAAAYTAVDDAETHRDDAYAINAEGPKNLAAACARSGATLVHLSTDYVFGGDATTPYPEDAPKGPASVYGQSKLAGEQAVLENNPDHSIILRTAWLYGVNGSSFPRSILSAGQTREHLDVVDDQVGQPTWTVDVVGMIEQLVNAGVTKGIFHATNAGQTSWHGFACKLFELAGWDTDRVAKTTTSAFPRPAPRPAWSVLGHTEWSAHGLKSPRAWEDALAEAWDSGLSQFARGQ